MNGASWSAATSARPSRPPAPVTATRTRSGLRRDAGFGHGLAVRQPRPVLAFVVGVPVAGLRRPPPRLVGLEPVDGRREAVGEGGPVLPAERRQLRAVEGVAPVVAGPVRDAPDQRPRLAEPLEQGAPRRRGSSSRRSPGCCTSRRCAPWRRTWSIARRGRRRTASRVAGGRRRRAAAADRRSRSSRTAG